MSRIVFGGMKHPAHARQETFRRLNELLPHLTDLLRELELHDLELHLKSDGRAELSISNDKVTFRGSADVHPEVKTGFDPESIFG